MKLLTGVVRAVSALHFGAERYGVLRRSWDYVPGSSIAGAIGEGLTRLHCNYEEFAKHSSCPEEIRKNCPYHQVLGEDGKPQLFIKPGLPAIKKNKSLIPLYPSPLDLGHCPNCGENKRSLTGICPSCLKDLEITEYRQPDGTLHPKEIEKEIRESTAIDRVRGSYAEVKGSGTLHMAETIPRRSRHIFNLFSFDKESMGRAVRALKFIEEGQGIGGKRSRGLGDVSFEWEVRPFSLDELRTRGEYLEAFQSLRLEILSPTILLEEGESLLMPTVELLRKEAEKAHERFFGGSPKIGELEIKSEESLVEDKTVTGWDMEREQRKKVFVAIGERSTFLFETGEGWGLPLACLEVMGIGEWNRLGYGHIYLSTNDGGKVENPFLPGPLELPIQRTEDSGFGGAPNIFREPVENFDLKLEFEKPISRDTDSLRGVLRGFAGKHAPQGVVENLYNASGVAPYRFRNHEMVSPREARVTVSILDERYRGWVIGAINGLQRFGENEGILSGDEKIKFSLELVSHEKRRIEPVPLSESSLEIDFRTPIILENLTPWNIFRSIGSKAYGLYGVEIMGMARLKKTMVNLEVVKMNLSDYLFRRRGNAFNGWEGSIEFPLNGVPNKQGELMGALLGLGRETGVGRFTVIGFGDFTCKVRGGDTENA